MFISHDDCTLVQKEERRAINREITITEGSRYEPAHKEIWGTGSRQHKFSCTIYLTECRSRKWANGGALPNPMVSFV